MRKSCAKVPGRQKNQGIAATPEDPLEQFARRSDIFRGIFAEFYKI
jgi:hypothetical protein